MHIFKVSRIRFFGYINVKKRLVKTLLIDIKQYQYDIYQMENFIPLSRKEYPIIEDKFPLYSDPS